MTTRDPRLERYKSLLLTWNEKINLIGPEARANIDDHIDEALAAAEILKPAGDVLDFGSGGGLARDSDGDRFPGSAVPPRRGGPEEVGVSEARRTRMRVERLSLR